ncbi:Elongation of very long chain fatty acids protein AAEL008004 [Anthophora quadrimaculata]
MAQLVRTLYDGYRDLMDNKSDPRVNSWAMMSGPLPTLTICLSYVYFVKVLGPKLMENRKPFDLRRTMIFYNLFQVIFSTWLFKESLMSGWGGYYSFRCQPVDYSNDPLAVRMANACWWYYFSKFTEFVDTIFFVLRKKNNHISTLHVIHHGCMPMSVWFGVKFTPGGHSTFFGLLNTFVHIVMYSYYLLAALGPKVQPFLWWKKYLTSLQMVQFVLVMIHAFQLLFIECNYPKAFVWWIGMHAVMFYFLFRAFYYEAYKKKKLSLEKKNQALKDEKEQQTETKRKDANGVIYADQYKMATGYISDNGLRNRVFIDNRSFQE